VALEVLSRDALSGVAGVSWQYPGGEMWYAAASADGVWGGQFEVSRLTLPAAIKGDTKVTIRVRDVAGNSTDLTVTMPDGAKDTAAEPTKGK
jgi:hypothetical protein